MIPMRYYTLLFSIIFLSISSYLYSQSNVTGKIIDTNGEPISFANILLLNPSDSSLVKGDLTDLDGQYMFECNPGDELIFSGSYIGYNSHFSEAIRIPMTGIYEHPDIILGEGLELDEVQVVARRPLYERKIDRMVVNVANSITSSGSTALEVLEKSPGVIVNRQNNSITMMGKTGVGIMINGKVSYQPIESILPMLNGMSSSNIEKIELITTPPAHLDAAGVGGYINIVLKQRADLGLSGNLSLSAGYGEGETGSGNLGLNYRKGNWNLYGNYNYSLQAQYQEFFNYRKLIANSTIEETQVLTERDPTQVNHDLRLGADYTISDNTTLGVLLAAYDNKWTMDAFNTGAGRVNSIVIDSISMDNSERNQWKHFMANFNIEHKFANGSKINFNIDRIFYEDENPTNYFTNYYDENLQFIRSEDTRSDKFTPIDISVGQLDYSGSISDQLKYQLGTKIAVSQFENDVSVEAFDGSEWQLIDRFTNFSDLDEKIFAGYVSFDYELDQDNTFKIGLRYEYSDSELNTIKEGTVVDREFGTFFPTMYYNKVIDDNNSLGISLNRRITRPGFDDMAPFAIFLDPSTYFFGNPGLQPAITNSAKVDYSYKSINLSIQYSVEDSTIARFQDFVDPVTNEQLFKPINLSETQLLTANLSFPIHITRHWEMQNNIIASNIKQISYFESELIELNNFNYNINTTQTFLFGNGYSGEVNYSYTSNFLWGRSELEPMYILNFGFQKKFDNGSNLSINLRDALNSFEWRGGTNLIEQGFLTDGYFDFSNRTLSISYTTNFGNQKLKARRDRQTGSEAERARVN